MRPFNKTIWNRTNLQRNSLVSLCVPVVLLGGLALLAMTIGAEAQSQPQVINGLLVLDDGRVVTGNITILERGYMLTSSSGRSTIPFSNVTCHAKTLKEAYRKQRDAMTKPTAEQHVALARWCLTNRLYAAAEQEIHSALDLQPHHRAAIRLLKQFDEKKPKDEAFTNKKMRNMMDKMIIDQTFKTAEPIGGLDERLAQQFVSKIEPLMMNSCANTSCHGQETTSSFRLTHKWNLRGNTRHITDRNLEQVLRQIDPGKPENSPLLTVLNGSHGGYGQPVFRGAKADYQRKLLQQWTLAVGNSLLENDGQLTDNEKPVKPDDLIPPDEIQQVSHVMPVPALSEDRSLRDPNRKDPLTEARKEQAHDPFDPDIFNRRVHGKE